MERTIYYYAVYKSAILQTEPVKFRDDLTPLNKLVHTTACSRDYPAGKSSLNFYYELPDPSAKLTFPNWFLKINKQADNNKMSNLN